MRINDSLGLTGQCCPQRVPVQWMREGMMREGILGGVDII